MKIGALQKLAKYAWKQVPKHRTITAIKIADIKFQTNDISYEQITRHQIILIILHDEQQRASMTKIIAETTIGFDCNKYSPPSAILPP